MQYEVCRFDKMRKTNWIKLSSQFEICGNPYTNLEEAEGLALALIGKGYKIRTEHYISFQNKWYYLKKYSTSFCA